MAAEQNVHYKAILRAPALLAAADALPWPAGIMGLMQGVLRTRARARATSSYSASRHLHTHGALGGPLWAPFWFCARVPCGFKGNPRARAQQCARVVGTYLKGARGDPELEAPRDSARVTGAGDRTAVINAQ